MQTELWSWVLAGFPSSLSPLRFLGIKKKNLNTQTKFFLLTVLGEGRHLGKGRSFPPSSPRRKRKTASRSSDYRSLEFSLLNFTNEKYTQNFWEWLQAACEGLIACLIFFLFFFFPSFSFFFSFSFEKRIRQKGFGWQKPGWLSVAARASQPFPEGGSPRPAGRAGRPPASGSFGRRCPAAAGGLRWPLGRPSPGVGGECARGRGATSHRTPGDPAGLRGPRRRAHGRELAGGGGSMPRSGRRPAPAPSPPPAS